MFYSATYLLTCKKRNASGIVLSCFQVEEETTAAGAPSAVKSDGFRVPPPPGYKPKPQTVAVSDSADVPLKKVRGTNESERFSSNSGARTVGQGQGHGSEKTVVCNAKTTGQKLLGCDRNICYSNTRSNSELLTLTFDLET